MYVPPAGHDAGTAIGSALWLYNHELNYNRIAPMSAALRRRRKAALKQVQGFWPVRPKGLPRSIESGGCRRHPCYRN